jgi:2-oxoglutarate ferredoxin oxidoreductase subunit alpha
MQARWGTHGDHPIIALVPSGAQEAYTLTVRAFNLAEQYRTPVILLLDAIVAQLKEKVEIPDLSTLNVLPRPQPTVPPSEYKPFPFSIGAVGPLATFGEGYRYHVTGLLHDEHGYPTEDPEVVSQWWAHMSSKLDHHLDDILQWEAVQLDDADIGLIAYGGTARAAAHAVTLARAAGLKVGLLRPITLWPFPEEAVRRLAPRVHTLVVPELNLGQIRLEVERLTAGQARVEGLHRADGLQITPDQILAVVQRAAADHAGAA